MLKLELELTKEEKQLLDDAVWYQVVTLAALDGGTNDEEKREFEIYKSLYKKLGNKLEKWVEEV
jgi:hypothetical protein